MELDTWIVSNVYNMYSILFSLPACSSVRIFSCLLNYGSCDNLTIIKIRCIKRGVSISSNYTNTDFNLNLIINANKQERIIIKDFFEGPVWNYCISRNAIKCLFYLWFDLNSLYFVTDLIIYNSTSYSTWNAANWIVLQEVKSSLFTAGKTL